MIARVMAICMDAGPTENTHRVRGIGACTSYLLQNIARIASDHPALHISFLGRHVAGNSRLLQGSVAAARRRWTAELTGVREGVHPLLAEQWKVMETSVFLASDVQHAGADVFLATDPQAVALSPAFRTVAVLYDLIPLIYPSHYQPWANPFARASYEAGLRRVRRADHVIAISGATKRDAVRLLAINPQRISVAPLAVDPGRFRPLPSEEARLHVAAQFNLHQPYFFYVGAFDYRKNIPMLLSALERVPGDVELVMAGPPRGPGARLRREADRSAIGHRVRWLGFVADEDLPSLYSASLGLVYPTLYEGFGLSVLEAMCSGTPVITSRCSSLPEVAGDAALFVDPTSAEEIATAMTRLVNSPEQRAELRKRGLLQAQKYSWKRTAERVLAICQAVGEGRAAD